MTVPVRFINSDGYATRKDDSGRLVKEHREVWERAHGSIPEGWHIHHRDGNRMNNALENLEALPWPEHKRAHCGHWRGDDGRWWKRCTSCGLAQPEDDFPTKSLAGGVRKTRGNCQKCETDRQREKRQRLYALARMSDPRLS